MASKAKTLDTIKEKIDNAINGHLNDEYIEKRIHDMINKSIDEIILKLMGFNTGWPRSDRFEVDHCNGRNGESFVGNYIKETCKIKLQEWANNVHIESVELPKSAVESMRKDFLSNYEYQIKKALNERATELAKRAAENYLLDLISEVPTVKDIITEPVIVKKNKVEKTNVAKIVGFEI